MELQPYFVIFGCSILMSVSEAGYCDVYTPCRKVSYSKERYTVDCGLFGWADCTRYRAKSSSYYQRCKKTICCAGYTGQSCSQAICHGSTSCSNGGTCTKPNFCFCRSGFASPDCIEINECLSNNGGCNQHCSNTFGSFICHCENGYVLDNDNKTCIDANECLVKNGGCSHICINTRGSYECNCTSGFVLESDRKTCTDKNECAVNNGDCNQKCVNDYRTYHCDCNDGFKLGSDGKLCEDIDECTTNSKCAHVCLNTVGSYQCSCRSGYILALDGLSCSDIDNCVGVKCQNGGSCTDNIGSYSCKCANGFEGQYCEKDINECLLVNGGCEDACINTPGSYHCQCHNGQLLNAYGGCSGKTNKADGMQQTIFEINNLARSLLPKGCAILELTSCGKYGSTKNILLSSTSSWYQLKTNSSIYFTQGIVFIESGNFALPVSISGLHTISTISNFELIFGSLQYTESNGIQLHNKREYKCLDLEITPKDVHALIASVVPTLFDKLYTVLPNWIRFSKSGTAEFSITNLKADLLYGEKLRYVSECNKAPVSEKLLYSVFQFGNNMNITLFENEVHLPAPLRDNKFCLVVDICQDNGGTAYLLLPPESIGFLERFDYFQFLHQRYGVIFRPYGIGLSLAKNIDVTRTKKQISVWNGDEIFQYHVFESANVWLHSDFEWGFQTESINIRIEGVAEIFLAVPSISNLLTGLFVDEWNALINVQNVGRTPTFQFKLFDQIWTLELGGIVTASIEAYLSIGGPQERAWCGNEANPEGIFLSFMTNLNPFRKIPIVGDWIFDANVRLHALFTTNPNHIPTSDTTINILTDIEDLRAAILRFGDLLTDLIQRFEKDFSDIIRVFFTDLQTFTSSFVQMLKDVIEIGKFDIEHISNITSNIWTTYIEKFKRKGQGVLDLLEFEKDVIAYNFTSFIKNEQQIIGQNVNKLLSKVISQVFSAIQSYNGFGLLFSADFDLLKLRFGKMDIEFIYSAERINQCSKFKKLYELLSGEPSVKVLARVTGRKHLGPPLTLGFFITMERSAVVNIALSRSSDKFAAHFLAQAAVLGMTFSGDVFITNNKFSLALEGRLWNVYFARFSLTTELGKVWKDLIFSVRGELVAKGGKHDFTVSYLDGLQFISQKFANAANKRLNAAKDVLTTAQQNIPHVQDKLTVAQQKVRNCYSNFDVAVNAMNKAKQSLENAKDPFQRALDKLRKSQKHLDSLCKIKTCHKICVPGIKFKICKKGWFRYPCIRTTSCMFRIPNIPCEIANVACRAVRALAYVALEAAKIFVRVPMLALDVAKAAVSLAQFAVDKSKVVLVLAEGVLEFAKLSLVAAKEILEVAKSAIDVVKFIAEAALHVFDLIVKYGLQPLLDVRNCKFDLELSTEDKAVFDVSCELQAFKLNWRTFRFEFDFRHPVVSMWRFAKSTVNTLMDIIGEKLGKRKRRAISYKYMSTLHHMIHIYKRDVTNQSEYMSFSKKYANESFQFEDDNSEKQFKSKFKNQIEYFAFNCELFLHIYLFLIESIDNLNMMTNESTHALNDAINVRNSLNDMNMTLTADTFTADALGISTDYALREFNISDEDLQTVIGNSTDIFSNNSYLAQMADVSNFAADLLNTQMADADSISVIEHWIHGMTNTSRDFFEETECFDFKDCVLFSFARLHDIFDDDVILDIEYSRNATVILEDLFSDLLFNSTISIKDTNRLLIEITDSLTYLNDSNVYCAIPPKVSIELSNSIALIGSSINIICNATGDPRPTINWYHNGNMLYESNQKVLHLNNLQQNHEGIYKCIAENVVANVSSTDKEIFVKECLPGTYFDNGMCLLCEIGMYQPQNNKRKCIACGKGLKTSASGSKEVLDCADIDECAYTTFVCEHTCTNTNGSFVCSCSDGYTLHSDGKTCTGKEKKNDTAKIAAGVIVGITVGLVVFSILFKLKQPKNIKVEPYPDVVKRPDSVKKPVLKHAFLYPVPAGEKL